ncbi:MAG: metal-sensitive transcriptional regulator [Clostridia bacterium]|nr:metal-sensitive transcriptional regulator [Clostridia bacterium]
MENEQVKKNIINRLKTIKGHIAGIERMIEEGKPCNEVLLQIAAIKASVHKVGLVIMEESAMDCLIPNEEDGRVNREEMENIIKTLIQFSK